jgi:hypothetical protein
VESPKKKPYQKAREDFPLRQFVSCPEDYDSMRFEREVEKNQVGVGDGD